MQFNCGNIEDIDLDYVNNIDNIDNIDHIDYDEVERIAMHFDKALSEDIKSKLLSHQYIHTINMIDAIKHNDVVLDGSSTGTGKTYTTAAICKIMNRRPFVVCLKSNIDKWKKVLKLFNVEPLGVINYESVGSRSKVNKNNNPYFVDNEWDFKDLDVIMIFDEVHVCKNPNTFNSKLMTKAKDIRASKTIMISATLCDKMEDFRVFGMMLGFYKTVSHGRTWMNRMIKLEKSRIDRSTHTDILNRVIFSGSNIKGSKMNDLPDSMHKIVIECYTIDDTDRREIDKIYTEIEKLSSLQEITFRRQKIENIKTSIILEQLLAYNESNMSVVAFVNYRSSHDIICKKLDKLKKDYAMIHGSQTQDQRTKSIDSFQNNEVRIMIAMSMAGGSSIDLHDTSGMFSRVSLISPSYSIIELTQILGRIKRADTRSATLQKIIYCSNTCEEHIAQSIQTKKSIARLIG